MTLRPAGPTLLLALLAACGGSSKGPGPATSLHYVDPPATGFRLVVEPATNNTAHLVLDLVGPSGTPAHGVACFLTCDAKLVSWGNPGGADPLAKAGTAFTLGPAPLFKTKLDPNARDLQLGLFQTGAPAAVLGSAPIASLELDLVTTAGTLSGAAVALAPTLGKTSEYLDGQKAAQPFALGVGVLTAQ